MKRVQTSTGKPPPVAFLVVTTTLTGATTPVLTITYKNQAGTGSKTATLTLPSNPVVNSAFIINPHLASGDSGVQDITNLSISTGTGGVIKIYGALILGKTYDQSNGGGAGNGIDPLVSNEEMWLCETNDVIGFYTLGTQTSVQIVSAQLAAVADYTQ